MPFSGGLVDIGEADLEELRSDDRILKEITADYDRHEADDNRTGQSADDQHQRDISSIRDDECFVAKGMSSHLLPSLISSKYSISQFRRSNHDIGIRARHY